MGNILGVAVTITLFETFKELYTKHGQSYENAFLNSYHTTMGFGVFFGITCLICAYIAYKPKHLPSK